MINQPGLIIAHRGESFDAPENTLAAVQLAWQRGAEAVEIDIQLSKDGNIVVIHDTYTWRTGRKYKKVKRQTLVELSKLDVGGFKGVRWKGEKIPTLAEVLHTVPKGKKLIIEIKSDAAILPFLKDEISRSGLQKAQIEIIGFDLATVVQAKKAFPEHIVLWLSDLDYYWPQKIFRPSIDKIIARTVEGNLDGLDVWVGKMITREFVEKVKTANLRLYTWTVNDPDKARILMHMGVDGITTDRAQWLKAKLF